MVLEEIRTKQAIEKNFQYPKTVKKIYPPNKKRIT